MPRRRTVFGVRIAMQCNAYTIQRNETRRESGSFFGTRRNLSWKFLRETCGGNVGDFYNWLDSFILTTTKPSFIMRKSLAAEAWRKKALAVFLRGEACPILSTLLRDGPETEAGWVPLLPRKALAKMLMNSPRKSVTPFERRSKMLRLRHFAEIVTIW
jgi:hypothetical protein